jgi:hypothetical protein
MRQGQWGYGDGAVGAGSEHVSARLGSNGRIGAGAGSRRRIEGRARRGGGSRGSRSAPKDQKRQPVCLDPAREAAVTKGGWETRRVGGARGSTKR